MNLSVQVFALIAALLHVLIFCMESLWFMKPQVYKRFGSKTVEDAESKRLFAFNQGFYNLFLAIGIFIGLGLLHSDGHLQVAQTLILFCTASMFFAGIILIISGGMRMLRAGVIQLLFPSLTWVLWAWF
ncbi:MAG TPA: DUF1304 domain-containing protein [Gammaproteobacteria bacterium]|nr:DUF1304 domain-containing protein [Xanthomonadales bacterium]HOP21327.1 DUF1304 domain-containing protein [Gammaproteobacteria bacterium]HPI94871.1 DUF1304 domain-containing protein [Gammaproteobacteria bacterium]HPQ86464.1 DUF1304 domain-containing protein [Gammaproteobacteria bacterium]